MKQQIRRVLALLLCGMLLLSAVPAVFAAESVNFRVILEQGNTDGNAVYVVTEPQFYTAKISGFYGDYAVFTDVRTGAQGIVDYSGAILYHGGPGKPIPSAVIDRNLFLGDTDYRDRGYLYNMDGERVFDAEVDRYHVGVYRDMATGEKLGYWIGNPSGIYGILLDPEDYHVLTQDGVGLAWNGMVPCRLDEKWGLLDLRDGSWRLPCVYDSLRFLTQDSLLCGQNGKYGVISPDGSPLSDMNYEQAECWNGGARLGRMLCCVFVVRDGKYGVLASDGSLIAAPEFDTLDFMGFEEEGYPYLFSAQKNGETRYYNGYSDRIVLQSEDRDAWTALPREGLYLKKDGHHDYLVDAQGTLLIQEPVWVVAKSKTSLILELLQSRSVRVYDWDMKLLKELPCEWAYSVGTGFAIQKRDQETGKSVEFYNALGTLVNTVPNAAVIGNDREIHALRREDGSCAFYGENGVALTDFIYDSAINVSSGYDPLSYPFYICTRDGHRGDGTYEIIDGRTGRNALFEGCTTAGDSYLLSEGGYFPIFSQGKTGVARLTKRGESPFWDVSQEAWYGDSSRFCSNAGLMNGTGAGSFSPSLQMTRAMLVQVLYSISGEPCADYGFTDLEPGAWYEKAVNWAAAKGIVSGTSGTSFAPNLPVTREQMVAILYKYAGLYTQASPDLTVLNKYSDADQIAEYARGPLAWAVENGLISGTSPSTVSPQGTADRAQVSVILMRFIQYMSAR